MRRSTAKPPPPPPTAPATAFTLQGRAAPGLYTLGWLGSAVGLALFFIALQTDPPVRGLLLMGSLLLLLAGLSSAAGYQIVERRQRLCERMFVCRNDDEAIDVARRQHVRDREHVARVRRVEAPP